MTNVQPKYNSAKKSVHMSGIKDKTPQLLAWFPNPLAAVFFKSDGDPVYPITFQPRYRLAYLIFVTGTTGGAYVKKIAQCNFLQI